MSKRHLDDFGREVGALGCTALVVACSSSSQPFARHVVPRWFLSQSPSYEPSLLAETQCVSVPDPWTANSRPYHHNFGGPRRKHAPARLHHSTALLTDIVGSGAAHRGGGSVKSGRA